jgi:hypothetical protein
MTESKNRDTLNEIADIGRYIIIPEVPAASKGHKAGELTYESRKTPCRR